MAGKVAIINYGVGNLYNIQKVISYLGMQSFLINSSDDIQDYSHIILPGVGSFPTAMRNLDKGGMAEKIKNSIEQGRLVLGICLGMHLLFEKSFELGETKGLCVLSGEIKRIPKSASLTVPNVGRHSISPQSGSYKYNFIDIDIDRYYFSHSFMAMNVTTKLCSHKIKYKHLDIPACVTNNHNVFGVQFHPELSGQTGLNFLNNFLNKSS